MIYPPYRKSRYQNRKIKLEFEKNIILHAQKHSSFQSRDVLTKKPSAMEGIVTRDAQAFSLDEFSHRVFKYVRKDHVKTDVHWKRNWKRAPLIWEKTQESHDAS